MATETKTNKRVPSHKAVGLVRFGRTDGGVDAFHVTGASIFDLLTVARYVLWAYGTEPHPTAPELAELQCQRTEPRVALAVQYGYEPPATRAYVHSPNFFNADKDTRGFENSLERHKKNVGFVLEAWPDGAGDQPDMACWVCDAQGKPQPEYTTTRRPASEVLAILGGPAVEDVVSRI